MITYALYLLSILAPVASPLPACETYAPRLDGSVVTVCDGRVVRVRFGTAITVTGTVGK